MRSKTKGNEYEQILLENVDREQTSDLMVDFFHICIRKHYHNKIQCNEEEIRVVELCKKYGMYMIYLESLNLNNLKVLFSA